MSAGSIFGQPVECDIERSEDDTDDITFHFTNADGTDAVIVGWTAILSIGTDNDVIATGFTATYPGTGIAAGLMPINMDGFDVPQGSFKYDVRVIDTVTGDAPVRVYVKGKFKVTPRIN